MHDNGAVRVQAPYHQPGTLDATASLATKAALLSNDSTAWNVKAYVPHALQPCCKTSPYLAPSFGEDGFGGLNGVTDKGTDYNHDNQTFIQPDIKPLTLTLQEENNGEEAKFKAPLPQGKVGTDLLDFGQPTPPLLSPSNSTRSPPAEIAEHSPRSVSDSNSGAFNEPLLVNTSSPAYSGHVTNQGLLTSVNHSGATPNSSQIPNPSSQPLHSLAPPLQQQQNHFSSDSSLAVRCTTQATVALLAKTPADNQYPYNSGAPYTPYSTPVIPQSRFIPGGYVDRPQFSYSSHRYHPYSPPQGTVPFNNGYHPSPYYQNYSNTSYGFPNPQFPPQNYLEFPDITQNNSLYYSSYNNELNHAYPGSMMTQREPILSTMDGSHGNEQVLGYEEPMGVQGAGFGAVPRESDSEDGQSPHKVLNAMRKKGDGSPNKDDVLKPKKAKTPKKRKKKDPNEPQKPVSAYAMFFRDTQASIKSSNPAATFGEVSKIVASMWDTLEEENKSDYKKRTEIAKKEYLQKLAAYRASLVSSGLDAHSSGSSGTDSSPRESPERIAQSEALAQMAPSMHHQSPPRIEQPMGMTPTPQFDQSRAVTGLHTMQVSDTLQQAPPGENMAGNKSGNDVIQNGTQPATNSQENENQESVNNTNNQSTIQTNVFYGKPPEQNAANMDPQQCVRDGCTKRGISSPQWDNEYCSNQCVVDHCRDVFTAWVASRSGYTPVN